MVGRRKALLAEVARRLAAVELFAPLDADALRRVAAAGTVERLGRGRTLFRTGDPPDRIHLVLAGALEIVRPTPDQPEPVPVAYLAEGELIGDMALLTGSPRRSTGRVPQDAVVWTLEREAFDRIAGQVPGYGLALAAVFARRLEDFISRLRRTVVEQELVGRLEHFDLPTVIQTLVSARRTGLLSVADGQGVNVAQVLFVDGEVVRARCRAMEGEAAFHEVFLQSREGEFFFRASGRPDPEAIGSTPIDVPTMHLLMDAVRIVDEVARLRSRLPPPATPLAATEAARRGGWSWPDAATLPAARALLGALATPRTLAEAGADLALATPVLCEAAARCLEAGLLAPAP